MERGVGFEICEIEVVVLRVKYFVQIIGFWRKLLVIPYDNKNQ
jgi:hypothetical protein